MGRFADKAKEIKKSNTGFQPLPLEEMNVEAIFNSCLKNDDTKEVFQSILFSRYLGYSEKDEVLISFDLKQLQNHTKTLEYLYGQLGVVHSGRHKKERLTIDDFTTTYLGEKWSNNNAILLELLYLGMRRS